MRRFLILILIFILQLSCSSTEHWVEFKSPENDYEILFPKKPSYSHETAVTGEFKIGIDIYSYTSQDEIPENISYSIIKTVYPDSIMDIFGNDIDAFFNKSIGGSIKSIHGELISQTELSINGVPGREARIDYQKGRTVVTARLFLKGNTSFLIQTNTPSANDLNPSQIKFLESFKFLY